MKPRSRKRRNPDADNPVAELKPERLNKELKYDTMLVPESSKRKKEVQMTSTLLGKLLDDSNTESVDTPANMEMSDPTTHTVPATVDTPSTMSGPTTDTAATDGDSKDVSCSKMECQKTDKHDINMAGSRKDDGIEGKSELVTDQSDIAIESNLKMMSEEGYMTGNGEENVKIEEVKKIADERIGNRQSQHMVKEKGMEGDDPKKVPYAEIDFKTSETITTKESMMDKTAGVTQNVDGIKKLPQNSDKNDYSVSGHTEQTNDELNPDIGNTENNVNIGKKCESNLANTAINNTGKDAVEQGKDIGAESNEMDNTCIDRNGMNRDLSEVDKSGNNSLLELNASMFNETFDERSCDEHVADDGGAAVMNDVPSDKLQKTSISTEMNKIGEIDLDKMCQELTASPSKVEEVATEDASDVQNTTADKKDIIEDADADVGEGKCEDEEIDTDIMHMNTQEYCPANNKGVSMMSPTVGDTAPAMQRDESMMSPAVGDTALAMRRDELDDITDSQLCAMDWSSQFPTDHSFQTVPSKTPYTMTPYTRGSRGPVQPQSAGGDMEDGSAIMAGLIKEVAQLNKQLLRTKREIETARRQRQCSVSTSNNR